MIRTRLNSGVTLGIRLYGKCFDPPRRESSQTDPYHRLGGAIGWGVLADSSLPMTGTSVILRSSAMMTECGPGDPCH
jgi:hypothetical protein